MMKIRNVTIGEGSVKTCVPIVEETQEKILNVADTLRIQEIDIVEWRIDFYEDFAENEKVFQTLSLLHSELGDKPILVTFRTAKEGGESDISFDDYRELLLSIAKSGQADLIDVEMFRGYDSINGLTNDYQDKSEHNTIFDVEDVCNDKIRKLVLELKSYTKVIGSYHDFSKTPSDQELYARMKFIDEIGADIVKMAVMPNCKLDVLRLMKQTLEYKMNQKAKQEVGGQVKPMITMAMSSLGLISRLAGESFGSDVSFGCMGKTSAPGQIDVNKLYEYVHELHGDR